MKKLLIAMIFVLGLTTSGWAVSFSYDLNYNISGADSFNDMTYVGSLGTITISDDESNSNWVDVGVTLNAGLKLLGFDLNYDGIENITNLTITGASLVASKDAEKADGFHGKFDIEVPANSNLGNVSSFAGILKATENLDAASFNALDTLNLIHVSAHIGEGTAELPCDLDDSIWVGDGQTPGTPSQNRPPCCYSVLD